MVAEVNDDDGWQEVGRGGGSGGGVTVWRTTAAKETRRMVGG